MQNKIKEELKDKIQHIFNNIKDKESRYKCFEFFEEKLVLNQIEKINLQPESRLEGITFGLKDVYNYQYGFTKRGSAIYEKYKAGNNARIVDKIIQNKGIIIGKTKTAEFSIDQPPNTINYYNKNLHVGTSSSGSAVGCKLNFFDIGLGTQTAGSTFRPSSYNGLYGFKPSFGLFPRTGLLKTTDTLDHVTLIGKSINNLKKVFETIKVEGSNYPLINKYVSNNKKFNKKIFFLKGYLWSIFESSTRDKIESFINKLKDKYELEIINLDLHEEYKQIHKSHEILYNKSLSYYFKDEYKNNKNKIGQMTIKRIENGMKIDKLEFEKNLLLQQQLIDEYSKLIGDNIVISPCTSGEAPELLLPEKKDMCLFHTYLHVPSISLPIFKGPKNLPFSIIMSSSKYNDYLLFDALNFFKNNKIIKDL